MKTMPVRLLPAIFLIASLGCAKVAVKPVVSPLADEEERLAVYEKHHLVIRNDYLSRADGKFIGVTLRDLLESYDSTRQFLNGPVWLGNIPEFGNYEYLLLVANYLVFANSPYPGGIGTFYFIPWLWTDRRALREEVGTLYNGELAKELGLQLDTKVVAPPLPSAPGWGSLGLDLSMGFSFLDTSNVTRFYSQPNSPLSTRLHTADFKSVGVDLPLGDNMQFGFRLGRMEDLQVMPRTDGGMDEWEFYVNEVLYLFRFSYPIRADLKALVTLGMGQYELHGYSRHLSDPDFYSRAPGGIAELGMERMARNGVGLYVGFGFRELYFPSARNDGYYLFNADNSGADFNGSGFFGRFAVRQYFRIFN